MLIQSLFSFIKFITIIIIIILLLMLEFKTSGYIRQLYGFPLDGWKKEKIQKRGINKFELWIFIKLNLKFAFSNHFDLFAVHTLFLVHIQLIINNKICSNISKTFRISNILLNINIEFLFKIAFSTEAEYVIQNNVNDFQWRGFRFWFFFFKVQRDELFYVKESNREIKGDLIWESFWMCNQFLVE